MQFQEAKTKETWEQDLGNWGTWQAPCQGRVLARNCLLVMLLSNAGRLTRADVSRFQLMLAAVAFWLLPLMLIAAAAAQASATAGGQVQAVAGGGRQGQGLLGGKGSLQWPAIASLQGKALDVSTHCCGCCC